MIQRRPTKKIRVGDIILGGGHPVRVQTMCTTNTADIKATVKQILELEKIGCELIRVNVTDEASAVALSSIKKQIHIPLIADVLFAPDLIIKAIRRGADKIRINPGKFQPEDLKKIITEASVFRIPVRIGINSGALPETIIKNHGNGVEGLVYAALSAVSILEALDFTDSIISIKSTDVLESIEANREFVKRSHYPIHLGVTQSGTVISGITRSSVALGTLLSDGIGDTVRFSLSGDPKVEVLAAHALLRSLHIRSGPIVLAGSSSRSFLDVESIAQRIEEEVAGIAVPIRICIIGSTLEKDEMARCDLGVAGEGKHGILYKNGVEIAKVSHDRIIPVLMAEIKKMVHPDHSVAKILR